MDDDQQRRRDDEQFSAGFLWGALFGFCLGWAVAALLVIAFNWFGL